MSQHPVDPQPGRQQGAQHPPVAPPPYQQQPHAQPYPGPPHGQQPPLGAPAFSPGTERQLVLAAHWSPIASVLLFGLTWIGPLAVYLIGRDRSPEVREHAADALNFQITTWVVMLALVLVSIPLMLVLVGFALIWFVALVPTVALVVHGVAAFVVATGGRWRYPFALRLVR